MHIKDTQQFSLLLFKLKLILVKFTIIQIWHRLTADKWHLKTWNYALVAIITVMLIGAVGVLCLAVIKLYFRVIKGNQSLGLSLLVGVIILYITGYVFVFESTDTVSFLVYFLPFLNNFKFEFELFRFVDFELYCIHWVILFVSE